MPYPNRPSLSLTPLTSTSFSASVSGDPGVTHRLFYRLTTAIPGTETTGPTRVGDGTLTVSSLQDSSQYFVYDLTDNGSSYSLPFFDSVSLNTSDTILAAVKTKWNLSPTLLTKGGRIFANEIPERDELGQPIELPYTWLSVSKSHYNFTTENLYFEASQVEFITYAVGAAAAEDASNEVKNIFSWKPLPFLNTTLISVCPVDDSVDSENLRDKNSNVIYRASTCFQIIVNRYLPA